MNYIYKYFFLQQDLEKYSELINLVKQIPDDADIIYVAESSNITYRSNDQDKRYISEMLADYYTDLKVYDITKPAGHGGVYKVLLQNIPKTSKAKTIIVTLNLRSFNASWKNSVLETSLQKSLVLLKDYPPLFNRFMLSFKAYDIKNKKERERLIAKEWKSTTINFPYTAPYNNIFEWDLWMANNGFRDKNGKKDKKKVQLACSYIKAYGFQIDTNTNVRIKDFDDIVELAGERGWQLVFNLLPENTQTAEKLVGDDLIYLMEHNRRLLVDYYTSKGVIVIDNLNAVDSEEFVDQNWTTEHYAELGRKIIAEKIALKLEPVYPESFNEVTYTDEMKSIFLNNCDGNHVWGHSKTISNTGSYSGNYSSKTGKGNDYSISFEYPLSGIPDSLKNSISISLKAYQYSKEHKASLIVSAKSGKTSNYWKAFRLSSKLNEVNKWEDYKLTINITDKIKQSEMIKVYVLNKSNSIILIDDFLVEFN